MHWEGSTDKRGRGQPTKYDPEISPQIGEKYAALGYTNLQIAKKLGIGVATLYVWQREHAEFTEAVKRAKDIVDDKVEQKLFKWAMGYSYTEITRESVEGKMVVTRKLTKKLPPDVTAQIFWLKNRRPDAWRDRKDIVLEGRLEELAEAFDRI